jgi:hypothetical protein
MIAGIFDEFFGVPTHPLAVHAPVVLIPIVAVVSVVVLFRQSWRERASVPLAALAFVMVAMLFVAKESGESAKDANNVFGNIDRHEELGNQTFVIGLVWLGFAIAAGVAVFLHRRNGVNSLSAAAGQADRSQVVLVLNVLATVALIITTIWLIRTGHAGAESRWVV